MICRFCNYPDLTVFADLGSMPLAGEFLKKRDVGKEQQHPLKVYSCPQCSLVQLETPVAREMLFGSFLSSVAMKEHFREYAKEMARRFLHRGDFVVEIGSNDGALLAPLRKLGIRVFGVEPVAKIASIARKRGIPVINDYFSLRVSQTITEKADAVFANNVMAHIEDLDDIMKGIKIILKPNGIFIFEVHSLLDLINTFQYDNIYHEHIYYFSVASLAPFLKKHEFEIFEVKQIPTHAGSLRIYAKQLPQRRIDEFKDHIQLHREELVGILQKLHQEGKRVIGYGASGRANTLLNWCHIGTDLVSYIVDESPLRFGRFTPGMHIPVIPPDNADFTKVDYVLILAWNYEKEIREKLKKYQLKFIIPLPEVSVS